jgi:hypothetical protein
MSGGLSTFAFWPGYYIFPDHKPFILTSYIFQKYVLPLFLGKHVNEYGSLPPVGQTEEGNLRRFNALVSSIVTKRKLVIFLYPTKAELLRKEGWTHAIAPVQETCKAQRFICVDLAREKTWTVDSYKLDRRFI